MCFENPLKIAENKIIIGIIIGFMLGIILLSVNVASLVEAIYLPEVAAYNYIQGLIPQGGV